MTRWYPDTCSCVIDLDDATGEAATIVQACALHGRGSDPHLAAQDHNRRKNRVHALIEQYYPELLQQTADGGTVALYGFTLSQTDGVLTITVPATFGDAKIANAQTRIDTAIGAGLVVIVKAAG